MAQIITDWCRRPSGECLSQASSVAPLLHTTSADCLLLTAPVGFHQCCQSHLDKHIWVVNAKKSEWISQASTDCSSRGGQLVLLWSYLATSSSSQTPIEFPVELCPKFGLLSWAHWWVWHLYQAILQLFQTHDKALRCVPQDRPVGKATNGRWECYFLGIPKSSYRFIKRCRSSLRQQGSRPFHNACQNSGFKMRSKMNSVWFGFKSVLPPDPWTNMPVISPSTPAEILVFSLNLAAGDYLSGLTVAQNKSGELSAAMLYSYDLQYSVPIPVIICHWLLPKNIKFRNGFFMVLSVIVLAGSTLQSWRAVAQHFTTETRSTASPRALFTSLSLVKVLCSQEMSGRSMELQYHAVLTGSWHHHAIMPWAIGNIPGWCTPQPSAKVFSHQQVDGYIGPKVSNDGLKTLVLYT